MTHWQTAKLIGRWTLWGLIVIAVSGIVGGLWAALLVRVFLACMRVW